MLPCMNPKEKLIKYKYLVLDIIKPTNISPALKPSVLILTHVSLWPIITGY
jgi:hypothetical protein